MIKALLIIFTVGYGGSATPTIIPFDSMDSCVNAKTIILFKYKYNGFWNSPKHIINDDEVDCIDVGPK